MMAYSTFSPLVTVWDSGHIEIDWTGSYNDTANAPGEVLSEHDRLCAGAKHQGLLHDLVVGYVSAPALRRLADHIDEVQGATKPKRSPTGNEKEELDAIIEKTT